MKKLWLTLGFLLGASVVHAAPVPELVSIVGMSSATVITISVSTTTATRMDNPTLTGRVATKIQNQSSTKNLWCAFNSSVTVSHGWEIAGNASPISWEVDFNWQTTTGSPANPTIAAFHIWCISDGATATTASVVQGY